MSELGMDLGALKPVFSARNQIIHEMDIHLEAPQKQARKRRSRKTKRMTQWANLLLTVGVAMIWGVQQKLRPNVAPPRGRQVRPARSS